jgi:hypothetical protein
MFGSQKQETTSIHTVLTALASFKGKEPISWQLHQRKHIAKCCYGSQKFLQTYESLFKLCYRKRRPH